MKTWKQLSLTCEGNMKTLIYSVYLFIAINTYSFGQVRVNGEIPGEFWRTNKVSGEVELFHIWGRTTVMPVKEAWVNIVNDKITIGAKADDPVLDSKPRKDYTMSYLSGKLQKEFPGKMIQIIIDTKIVGVGNNEEFRITRTAMIAMKDGRPESLIFTCMEYAAFDIPEFIKRLKEGGGIMAKRTMEDLEGFDELGFRQRTFKAVFN